MYPNGTRVKPSPRFNYAWVKDVDKSNVTPNSVGIITAGYGYKVPAYNVQFPEGVALGVAHDELIQVTEV